MYKLTQRCLVQVIGIGIIGILIKSTSMLTIQQNYVPRFHIPNLIIRHTTVFGINHSNTVDPQN